MGIIPFSFFGFVSTNNPIFTILNFNVYHIFTYLNAAADNRNETYFQKFAFESLYTFRTQTYQLSIDVKNKNRRKHMPNRPFIARIIDMRYCTVYTQIDIVLNHKSKIHDYQPQAPEWERPLLLLQQQKLWSIRSAFSHDMN